MPYIDLGELQLFYEEIGYGEPVLFLHSGYSRGFWPSADSSSLLCGGGYRCFYQISGAWDHVRKSGMGFCGDREDMIRFLDRCGIERIHLIGYSTGGGVAYYMAARHPERIKQ